MKKPSIIDYVLYSIARLASALLTALPVGLALKVGRAFGSFAYIANYKRARIAYSNMRAAFCGEKKPSEIRRIVKRLYRNFGETLAEILRTPRVDKAYVDKYVTVENRHYVDRALEEGRSLIFLTGHFGNWELSSITSALHGFPLMVLAREQKMSLLNDALNALRESKGCKVVKKGFATREIYEHLEKGGIVGILSDQDAGKRGNFVTFFGRPTSTARGAFALSRKTGAFITPAFMVRVKGPYHRLVLETPIHVPADGSGESEAMQKFASILEKYARKYPEQWLWLHKRWKSTTLRKTVILSDRKTGHLNQSLAVFEKIKECRRLAGYRDTDTGLKVIEIKYRTEAHRAITDVLSGFIAPYPLARTWCMKLCLKQDSYDELEKSYADIVLSCGAGTAAVNFMFARENSAKNAMIMRPGIIPAKRFNLVIVPEHDNAPRGENVVTTFGAPNLITPERLESGLRFLEKEVDLEGKKNIGLFIGGDNRHYTLDAALVKDVLEDVVGAADESGMNILVTTSRRTDGSVSALLKKRLEKTGTAKLVVIANERNPEWTMAGMLAASDVVVVSGESSSMLSEAASSGKPVIVFKPKRKPAAGKNDKHELFLDKLNSAGLIRVAGSGELKKNILELANSGEDPGKLDDNGKISEAVKRLI